MNIRKVRFLLLAGALPITLSGAWLSKAEGAHLKAAVAKLDITPPVGHQLWGNGERVGPSTGILDPIYARMLVLKSDVSSLAIVTLDLGRTFDDEQTAEVRDRIRRAAGIQHLIFAASHTHTGPTVLSNKYIQAGSHRWEPKVLSLIVQTIKEASQNMVPCRIGAGKGAAYIGHNRSDPLLHGQVLGNNETQVRTSPFDPIVQVLRVDDLKGTPIAVIVNHACHPIVLNSAGSTQYSADFPGVMCAMVEKNYSGQTICLFIQGAAGDIASRYSGYASSEKGSGGHGVMVREMRRLGRELGQEVIRVAGEIHPQDPKEPELQVIEEPLTFRARWNLEKLRALDAVPTYHQWLTTGRPLGFPLDAITVWITTVLINRQIAMVTMPGEPYIDYQIDFRSRLPGLDTILAGYSNGYAAYLPTLRAELQYEDATWPAILELGAGERIVDRGVVNVFRMLGRLKASPDRRDR